MNQKRGKTLQKAEAQGYAGQAVAGRGVFHIDGVDGSAL
jgi:hypothetical protein